MTQRSQLQEISHFRNAYILALSAAMGSIFYGWDIGLIGGILAMTSFQEYFGIDKKTASQKANLNGNIVSILQGGCFFGALFMSYFPGRFGRKPCLLAAGIIYLIGSAIQSISGLGSSQETALSVLYFSRFLGGIGVGMVSALVPSYVSECTPRAIRGRCTAMIQFANNIGIMLSFWVNYSAQKDFAPNDMQWRIPFIVQMVPGVLFVVAMLFQPETPRWLVEHGRIDEAASVLAYVARTTPSDPAVQATIEEVKAEFKEKHELPLWRQFVGMGESWPIAHRCFIPSLVMFFQQWTGTNAINYFSPQIFQGLGISGTTSTLFATGVYGVVKVIAVGLVVWFAVESLGRKNCLIIGGIGQGLMMLWIGGYSAVHKGTNVDAASYVSLVAVYLYAVFYCVGWGPVPWPVSAEVAPNHLRTVALSIAVGVNWLFSFTISKLTPIMLDNITYGTFLLFGIMCFIMSVWTYACFPETKGVALEDVKYLFEKDVVVRALQDAPGGRIFLKAFFRGRMAEDVKILREQDDQSEERRRESVGSLREDDSKSVRNLEGQATRANTSVAPI
ncbi:general substrate transporter [Dendrothele bispora CBS 962.96]|uniref:General substrate transporter n=1 Tax=Dendrothele bispora (strain CBS 962.96) TaxID=1314807 RepID=A0A4S8L6C9_DENBC|nr:general substrate transporter [Dendrothele bispora CBS 962.96]